MLFASIRRAGIIIAVKTARTINLIDSFKSTAAFLIEGGGHLLWPRLCCNCQASILKSDDGLCGECWEQLRFSAGGDYCRRCGTDASEYAIIEGACGQCQNTSLQFDGIARAGAYNDVLRNMILRMKFNDRPELGEYLGSISDAAITGSGFYDDIDLFVPVPLHWRRRLSRGFNQALIICQSLKNARKRIDRDLVRIRYTHRQWSLTDAGRKKNVAGAFAVRARHNYRDKTICLVDDITTSGATLNECAKTLKEAGAKKVYALVVAVAHGNSKK